jgi:hypothetical protein
MNVEKGKGDRVLNKEVLITNFPPLNTQLIDGEQAQARLELDTLKDIG